MKGKMNTRVQMPPSRFLTSRLLTTSASRYDSIGSRRTRVARVSSSGLVVSTWHCPILIAAFKSRFANSPRALALAEVINARIPRTRVLGAIWCSASAPYHSVAEALRGLLSISTF